MWCAVRGVRCVVCRVSCVVCRVRCVVCRVSCVMCRVAYVVRLALPLPTAHCPGQSGPFGGAFLQALLKLARQRHVTAVGHRRNEGPETLHGDSLIKSSQVRCACAPVCPCVCMSVRRLCVCRLSGLCVQQIITRCVTKCSTSNDEKE